VNVEPFIAKMKFLDFAHGIDWLNPFKNEQFYNLKVVLYNSLLISDST
jgi:hypothetical protein